MIYGAGASVASRAPGVSALVRLQTCVRLRFMSCLAAHPAPPVANVSQPEYNAVTRSLCRAATCQVIRRGMAQRQKLA